LIDLWCAFALEWNLCRFLFDKDSLQLCVSICGFVCVFFLELFLFLCVKLCGDVV
jgi:hypothetical protein